jgi:hypothetical protein
MAEQLDFASSVAQHVPSLTRMILINLSVTRK